MGRRDLPAQDPLAITGFCSPSLSQRAALKPPGGAARQPAGRGRSCFKSRAQRVGVSVPEPGNRAASRVPTPAQTQTGPGLKASPVPAQGAGLSALTSSARLRHSGQSPVRTCQLHLLHLPPLNRRGHPSEPWPTRGCSS